MARTQALAMYPMELPSLRTTDGRRISERETMTGKHVAALYARATDDHCFCGRKVKPNTNRTKRLCGSKLCRRAYQRAYWADHPRTTTLRQVVRVKLNPGNSAQAILKLSCGHWIKTPSRFADLSRRKHCQVCRALTSVRKRKKMRRVA